MHKTKRGRQNIAFSIGLVFGVVCLFVLFLPEGERYLKPGPMNTGHQDILCVRCHQPAAGSLRQQIQANTRFVLGYRVSATDYGRSSVANARCVKCHDRPDDRHPVYRFFEPRYKKARASLQPQYCNSCHREHTGTRVTQEDLGFCRTCHKPLALNNDPLSVSHQVLIKRKQWESCLGCHDFHGNHQFKEPTDLKKAIAPSILKSYFEGADSPYPGGKKHKALLEAE